MNKKERKKVIEAIDVICAHCPRRKDEPCDNCSVETLAERLMGDNKED